MERYVKAFIDVLIALLIITILGGVGFIGFQFYQNQQEKPVETANIPAAAPASTTPDATLDATPVPPIEIAPTAETRLAASPSGISTCSSEQLREVETVTMELETDLGIQLAAFESQSLETIQDLSAAVLDIDQMINTYQSTYYGRYPDCVEGVMMREVMGVFFEEFLNTFTLYVLGAYVALNGDQNTAQILSATADQHSIWIYDPEEDVAGDETESSGIESLPICGEQAARTMALYAPSLSEYQRLLPVYLDFMQTRYGDFNTLLQFENLALSVLEVETEFCVENVETELRYAQLFVDTATAIHIAQLAAFEANRGRQTTADALQAIVDERQSRVLENIRILGLM